MNLRLLKLMLVFLLMSVVADVSAQGAEQLMVVKNEPVTYHFLSRFLPAIGRSPDHGTATIAENPDLELGYTLTYTPDQDYLGGDQMLLISFPIGFNVAFTQFDIEVAEADIRARQDFAVAQPGTPVTVDVLQNDSVNIGGMTLTAAPAANAGTAEVIDGQIVFTPNPGFVGLTDLNYVVCSDFDVCDLGTVSINVLPNGDVQTADTVRVFTKRGEPQFIFAPANAVSAGPPAFGEMIDLNGVMAYQPEANFVGDEFLSYTTPGAQAPTVYHITVLDLATNYFAVEDRAFTAVDRSTTFNVLHNDVYDIFADCVTFSAPQFGTLTETSRKGEVIYTPPAGWTGVDKFTYSSKAPNCAGEAEVETAYVFVSNFAPSDGATELTTSGGVPVTITYEAPGGSVSWRVVSGPSLGTIIEDPASGQLSYLPADEAAGSTDEVVLEYCLNPLANGDCSFQKQVAISINVTASTTDACAESDCVWPGDTNNDGVVDVGDLLPIGLAMGASGTPRLNNQATTWFAQYAEEWGGDINGLNLKYVDANGDQVISSLDTQVVMSNLGLAHGIRPEPLNFSTFEISLRGPLEVEPGDLVALDIVAGNNVVIVEDVFGFRFTFNYDPELVVGEAVEIGFDEESWISYDSPILSLVDNKPSLGQVNTALTRTSSEGTSGYGILGQMNVVIVEDVFGFRETMTTAGGTQVENTIVTELGGGKNATVMNSNGYLNSARVNPFPLTIKHQLPTDAGALAPLQANDYLDEKLRAFPNPTSDRLVVHLNGQQRFTDLQLTDLTGRTVRHEAGLNTNHRELSLGDLPNGMYTLTLTTTDGVVNRKIEVLR